MNYIVLDFLKTQSKADLHHCRYDKVRLRRASAYLQLGRPAAALEDAVVVSSSEPGHKEALLLEACSFLGDRMLSTAYLSCMTSSFRHLGVWDQPNPCKELMAVQPREIQS